MSMGNNLKLALLLLIGTLSFGYQEAAAAEAAAEKETKYMFDVKPREVFSHEKMMRRVYGDVKELSRTFGRDLAWTANKDEKFLEDWTINQLLAPTKMPIKEECLPDNISKWDEFCESLPKIKVVRKYCEYFNKIRKNSCGKVDIASLIYVWAKHLFTKEGALAMADFSKAVYEFTMKEGEDMDDGEITDKGDWTEEDNMKGYLSTFGIEGAEAVEKLVTNCEKLVETVEKNMASFTTEKFIHDFAEVEARAKGKEREKSETEGESDNADENKVKESENIKPCEFCKVTMDCKTLLNVWNGTKGKDVHRKLKVLIAWDKHY